VSSFACVSHINVVFAMLWMNDYDEGAYVDRIGFLR
jgi:hypothetical protein